MVSCDPVGFNALSWSHFAPNDPSVTTHFKALLISFHKPKTDLRYNVPPIFNDFSKF
jgi:hypothetical protein